MITSPDLNTSAQCWKRTREWNYIQVIPSSQFLGAWPNPSLALQSISMSTSTLSWLDPGLLLSLGLSPEIIWLNAWRRRRSSWACAVSLARGASAWRDGRKADDGWGFGWKNRCNVCCRGSRTSGVSGVGSKSIVSISVACVDSCCFWAEKIHRSVFSASCQRLNVDAIKGEYSGAFTINHLVTRTIVSEAFSRSTVEMWAPIDHHAPFTRGWSWRTGRESYEGGFPLEGHFRSLVYIVRWTGRGL